MKINKIIFPLVLLFTGFIFTSCKDSVSPEVPVPIQNYFPLPNGAVLKYSVDSVSAGGQYYRIGTKILSFGPEQVTAGTPYYQQNEQIDYSDGGSVSQRSKVRKTERGLYYYLDTTGISLLIPDSLKPFIQIDREITGLSLPFYSGQSWSAFKFNVVIIPIINCTATYLGSTQISDTISGSTGVISAERVGYNLTISVPDLGQGPVSLQYSGEIWYSKNLGIVKREGDYFLFQFLGGSEIDFLLPNYKIREKLSEIIK